MGINFDTGNMNWGQLGLSEAPPAPPPGTGYNFGDSYIFTTDAGVTMVITPDSDNPSPPPPGQKNYKLLTVNQDGTLNQGVNIFAPNDTQVSQVIQYVAAEGDFNSVAGDFKKIRDSQGGKVDNLVAKLKESYVNGSPPMDPAAAELQAKADVVQILRNFAASNGLDFDPDNPDSNVIDLAFLEAYDALEGQGIDVSYEKAVIVNSNYTLAINYGRRDGINTFNKLASQNPSVNALMLAYKNDYMEQGFSEVEALIRAKTDVAAYVHEFFDESGSFFPPSNLTGSVNVDLAVTAGLNDLVASGKISPFTADLLIANATVGSVLPAWVGATDKVTDITMDHLSELALTTGMRSQLDVADAQIDTISGLIVQSNLPEGEKTLILDYLKLIKAYIQELKLALDKIDEVYAQKAHELSNLSVEQSRDAFKNSMEQLAKQIEAHKPKPWWKKFVMIFVAIIVSIVAVLAAPFTGGASLTAMAAVIAITIALTVVTTVLQMTGILEKGFAAMMQGLMKAMGDSMPDWAKKLIIGIIMVVVIAAIMVATMGRGASAVGALVGAASAQIVTATVKMAALQMGMLLLTSSGAINGIVAGVMHGWASDMAIAIVSAVVTVIVAVAAMAIGMRSIANATSNTVDNLSRTATRFERTLERALLSIDRAITRAKDFLGIQSDVVRNLQNVKDIFISYKTTISTFLNGAAQILGGVGSVLEATLYTIPKAKLQEQIGDLEAIKETIKALIKMLQKLVEKLLGAEGGVQSVMEDIKGLAELFNGILNGMQNVLANLMRIQTAGPSNG
jgi:nitrate reductase assembly molybdenum cofactor insertion protein NarJ